MSLHLSFILITLIVCSCAGNKVWAQSKESDVPIAIDFATLADKGIVPYIRPRRSPDRPGPC
jgi:hypothetical protein